MARKLFEEFSQADATTAQRFGGTGLGLASPASSAGDQATQQPSVTPRLIARADEVID